MAFKESSLWSSSQMLEIYQRFKFDLSMMANLKVDVEVNQMLHGIHVHFSEASIQSCSHAISKLGIIHSSWFPTNQNQFVVQGLLLKLLGHPQFWRKITSFKPSQVSPISRKKLETKLAPKTSDTWNMLQFTFSSPQRLNTYSPRNFQVP